MDLTGDMTQPNVVLITRIFTFKCLCAVLLYMTYNTKSQSQSLTPDLVNIILRAYQISIENLRVFMKTSNNERASQLLEEEFDNVKKQSLLNDAPQLISELKVLMANPLIMLPHINDRQINRRIPSQLTYVTQPMDILRTKIQIFLYLRQTIQLLIKPQPEEQRTGGAKEAKQQTDANPISRE